MKARDIDYIVNNANSTIKTLSKDNKGKSEEEAKSFMITLDGTPYRNIERLERNGGLLVIKHRDIRDDVEYAIIDGEKIKEITCKLN